MIAKLLIHPTLEARLEAIDKVLADIELKKDHPDVLWLGEDEKLGVESAKKIRQHLSLKPYSAKGRAVVVEHTHEMTLDAQNSLLKTLEEPPLDSVILLGADSEKNILPTVLSRVQVNVIANPAGVKQSQSLTPEIARLPAGQASSATPPRNDEIEKLLNSTIEQRLECIEKLEDKEAFFHGLLSFFHEKLKSEPKYADFAKELFTAEAWKESNGNIRAILEYLMLKLPKL